MEGLIGYYDERHYSVCVVNDGQIVRELYTAGNHKTESQTYVSPHSPNACTPTQMRDFCRQTTKEIAKEQRLPYLGIEKEEEE